MGPSASAASPRSRRSRSTPPTPTRSGQRRDRPRQVPARSSRGDVIRQKLEDKVVADATKPGRSARSSEIFIAARAPTDLPADGGQGPPHPVLARRTTRRARRTATIPADDPSWAAAEAEAKAAYDKIKADPTQFDVIARAESDETSAPGRRRDRRQAAVLRLDRQQVDRGVRGRRSSSPGLTSPATSSRRSSRAFGWHVVQVMYQPTDDADGSKAQDAGRRRRRLRAARPRQLRGRRGRQGRRPRLGRQGPARRPADRRRSSRRRSARRQRRRSTIAERRRRTCSRSSRRRPRRRRAASSTTIKANGLLRLVQPQEGRGRRSAGPRPHAARPARRQAAGARRARRRGAAALGPRPGRRPPGRRGRALIAHAASSRRGRS